MRPRVECPTREREERRPVGLSAMWGQVILGKYKVTRLLDEGGMCKVFLARQTSPERDVAVKMLKEPMQSHPRAAEFFRREIHIMSRFQHPHAVTYIDSTG